ncbi:MAG: TIGR02147 family protein [Bdellovibrionota bacterium]
MEHLDRVYAFDDPVEYLNFELRERQKRNPRFSLREWSRQVGYKNPSYLSHVLARKRRLKPEFAGKLAGDLALQGKPLKYFELLVLKQHGRSEPERETYGRLLAAARPRRFEKVNLLSLETFSLVSDWYHWAILEMVELKDADLSPRAVHRRLREKVPIRTVRAAIERLLRAGLLARDGEGGYRRGVSGVNKTHAPLPVAAVNAYHRQMGTLAVEAITSQPLGDRDFYGTTLAFRKENYQKARDIAQEAHRRLLQLAENGTGEEIYQFNTQLFRLTASGRKKK